MTDSLREEPRPDRLPRHDTVLRRRLLDLLIYCAQQGKVANGTTGAMDLLESYDATVRALRVVPPEGPDDGWHTKVSEALDKLREPCTPADRSDARLLLVAALRAVPPTEEPT
jgi:hypothetical protein